MKSKPKPYEEEMERRLKKVSEAYVSTPQEILHARMLRYCSTFYEDAILGLERIEFHHGLSMSWPEPKTWKLAIPEIANLVAGKGRTHEISEDDS